MAVLTAGRTGTPAAEAPARDDGGTRPGRHQQLWYTVLALGIAAAAFAGAWRLHGNTSSTYRIDSQWGAFTGLFILALAIERALEPFSRKLGPDTTTRKDTQLRALASAQPDDVEGIAVECQLAVDMCRRLTAVVTWGVATGLAFLLCAQLNITLMQAVRASGSGAPPFWADLLVTGLVVGAGTKPLHDLVSSIERGKQGPSTARSRTRLGPVPEHAGRFNHRQPSKAPCDTWELADLQIPRCDTLPARSLASPAEPVAGGPCRRLLRAGAYGK